jgi:hypothetical protein
LCRCTGHIRDDCPFPSRDSRSLEIEEESPFGSASEKVQSVLPQSCQSLELDSFIGKLKTFFPTFFFSLTKEDISLLSSHEEWLVGIFEGFWDIVLEKFKAKFPPVSSDRPSEISTSLTDPLDSTLPLVSPLEDVVSLNQHTYSPSIPEKALPSPFPPDTVLLPVQSDPSYKESLTKVPLQTFNSLSSSTSTLDRSNVTIRKNPKKFPLVKRKKELGVVEGGLSTSPVLTSLIPSLVSSLFGSLRETSPSKKVP